MSEFDEWYFDAKQHNTDGFTNREFFQAGQQSQQAKIDLLEVQLKGAEERAKLTLDHKNKMVDELQKKYDAMYNAFIVADDCRKEWHESYMSTRKECDELRARVGDGLKIAEDLMGEMQNYKLGESLENILKGNKDD